MLLVIERCWFFSWEMCVFIIILHNISFQLYFLCHHVSSIMPLNMNKETMETRIDIWINYIFYKTKKYLLHVITPWTSEIHHYICSAISVCYRILWEFSLFRGLIEIKSFFSHSGKTLAVKKMSIYIVSYVTNIFIYL